MKAKPMLVDNPGGCRGPAITAENIAALEEMCRLLMIGLTELVQRRPEPDLSRTLDATAKPSPETLGDA